MVAYETHTHHAIPKMGANTNGEQFYGTGL